MASILARAPPSSLLSRRLLLQTAWLMGTLALSPGYVFEAAALDRARLAIIQPPLVMTIVFALPLSYFLTSHWRGAVVISLAREAASGSERPAAPPEAASA